MTDATPDLLRALPKVELHVHLEGTLSAARIVELAERAGEPLPRPVTELFTFPTLSDALRFLDWSTGLIRDADTAAQMAYDFAARISAEGAVYAEVIVNPTHWPHWRLDALVEVLSAGFDRAARDGLPECRLLLSILRQQSGAEALDLVRWMESRRHPRVVGLSIDGNEAVAGRTGPRFAAAYDLAGALGFGRTAHAGESSGPEGVRDALDLLHVDRIDHGVRSAEDPALLQRLAEARTTLNICVSGNLRRLYPSLAAHPVARLETAGVPFTLNTDDPGYIGIGLTGEFVKVADHLGWSLARAADVTRIAIEAAFCSPARKRELLASLNAFQASG